MTFYEPGKFEVLTGVNLPMVLRLACQAEPRRAAVSELAHWLQDKAQRSVCLAGDLDKGRNCGPSCRSRCRSRRRSRMIERETEIVNRLGLHARAAAKLVHTAGASRAGSRW